jgi:transcriptional regulator with XRE-family HTH domain
VEKGWNAKGLLAAHWKAVGGRDALAEATGISGATLSGYNSGSRNLGMANARRIADALGISVLELGAPLAEVDEQGATLATRLEELATQLAEAVEQQAAANRAIARLQARVRRLEARPALAPNAATESAS